MARCKFGRRLDGKCRKTRKPPKYTSAQTARLTCAGVTRRSGRFKLKKGWRWPGGGRCPVPAKGR